MTGKVVAIHQPNFFPWLGYFDKIARCDVFILMDNAQFSKTGGNWVNRVQLLVNGELAWVTVPIVRAYHGTRQICEMKINNTTPWRDKVLNTLKTNYARAAFFNDVFPLLSDLLSNPTESLADLNVTIIRVLVERLRLNPSQLVLGSTLNVAGSATDLLIAMVKAVGGDAYLCGGGAAEYQEDKKFSQAGIELIYQNFKHPVYTQRGIRDFVAGLSIMDSLMDCGFEGSRHLLLES
jgi:hypothetical protein